MRSATERPALERVRSVLCAALLAVVILAPLPFGTVTPGWILTLELVAATLGALAIAIELRDPRPLPRSARVAGVLSLALICLGVLQLIPMPRALVGLLVPGTAAGRARLAELVPVADPTLAPASLAAPDTLDALLRLAAYVLLAFAAVVAARNETNRRRLAWAAIASGAFQGLYGAAEYLSGHQHIFGYAKLHYLDSATGTFINRNHFASYLALTLPIALGVALESARCIRPATGWRERALRWTGAAGGRAVAASAAAVLIWSGVVLSYSRGGLLAALIASGWVAFTVGRRRRAALALIVLLALPVAALLWRDIRAPGERFVSEASATMSVRGRLPVWGATLDMAGDFIPLGSGFGTFEASFERYRPPEVRLNWRHAHNDWLQTLAEGGPLAVLIVLMLLALVLRRGRTADARSGESAVLRCGVAAALAALAFHGLVDFAARIPAVATLGAVLVGVLCSVDTRRATAFIPRTTSDP